MANHLLNPAIAALCLGLGCANAEPLSPVVNDRPLFQTAPADGKAVASGAERFTYRIDLPIDWLLTPSEFPCLSEAIQTFGSFEEYLNFVDSPGSIHVTVHQSTNNVGAVGLTTGDTYRFSGPLTFTASASTAQGEPLEFTFHNINHFVGPGPDSDIYLRTLVHVTRDQATGETKVEVLKDEVLCH